MNKRFIILSLLLPMLLACCGQRGKSNNDAEVGKKEIKMPTISAIYASEQDRAAYLAEHFWDNFDFTDTSYISIPDITEQAFSTYLHTLNIVPAPVGAKAIDDFMLKIDSDSVMLKYFAELLERYLYEPNSPVQNEELYIRVLRYVLDSPKFEEIEKLRPRAHLEMALKNRVGEKTTDFQITTREGSKIRLYGVKAQYTLLYFNNPDCITCTDIMQQIKASNILMPLINQKVLEVVALYPDEDLAAWHEHQTEMPDEWINGYDAGGVIRDKQLYDLKAIPSLYLLDKDKKVVVKDIDQPYLLENYFRGQGY